MFAPTSAFGRSGLVAGNSDVMWSLRSLPEGQEQRCSAMSSKKKLRPGQRKWLRDHPSHSDVVRVQPNQAAEKRERMMSVLHKVSDATGLSGDEIVDAAVACGYLEERDEDGMLLVHEDKNDTFLAQYLTPGFISDSREKMIYKWGDRSQRSRLSAGEQRVRVIGLYNEASPQFKQRIGSGGTVVGYAPAKCPEHWDCADAWLPGINDPNAQQPRTGRHGVMVHVRFDDDQVFLFLPRELEYL